jgi:hypothetical protein
VTAAIPTLRAHGRYNARPPKDPSGAWFDTDRLDLRSRSILLTTNGNLWFEEQGMSTWNIDRARRTYSIAHWGEGYFDIDDGGRIVVRPHGAQGPSVALPEAVDRALAGG